jgi:hypothetical protein
MSPLIQAVSLWRYLMVFRPIENPSRFSSIIPIIDSYFSSLYAIIRSISLPMCSAMRSYRSVCSLVWVWRLSILFQKNDVRLVPNPVSISKT